MRAIRIHATINLSSGKQWIPSGIGGKSPERKRIMAFFENLGGTLAAKGKDVAEKAKEIAEVNRLNGQIHTQKHAAEKIYIEIGKMVSGQREDLSALNVTEHLEKLDSIQAEIARLQKEVLRVKGVRQCENCKAEISGNMAFCPECGSPVPAAEEDTPEQDVPTRIYCPDCHREVEPDMVLCPFCGVKLK